MSDKKEAKKVPEDLKESVHKIWLAGLGALSAAEEEGTKLFKSLVEKGEAYEKATQDQLGDVKERVEKTAKKARSEAEDTWEKIEGKVDDLMSRALGKVGVPSRDEIQTLTQRVEELTRVVEQLKNETQKKTATVK